MNFASDLAELTTDGYQVVQISPADDPSAALLVRGGESLNLRAIDSTVELRPAEADPVMPALQPRFELSRLADHPSFGSGRAGMEYRDLIPSRQGGRIIASHIRISEGGPVDDYVHFHNICFQMIYVHSGWVRLVYEDQGEPFVMSAGDCVLQPPRIRHQVLESSAGLEVIEVAAPASHDTYADLNLELPTDSVDANRDFGGQKFWLHKASEASWEPSEYKGFSKCDLGLGEASSQAANVTVYQTESAAAGTQSSEGESQLLVALEGEISLDYDHDQHLLTGGDCVVIPGGQAYHLSSVGPAKVLSVDFIGLP